FAIARRELRHDRDMGALRGALEGRHSSVLRLRARNVPPPPLHSVTRGTSVRVFTALPVTIRRGGVAAPAQHRPMARIRKIFLSLSDQSGVAFGGDFSP